MKKFLFLLLIIPLFFACSGDDDGGDTKSTYNPVLGEWAYWTTNPDPENDMAVVVFTEDFKTNCWLGSTFYSYTVDTKRIYFESEGAGFLGYRIYKEDNITFMILHGEGMDDDNCPNCGLKLYKVN